MISVFIYEINLKGETFSELGSYNFVDIPRKGDRITCHKEFKVHEVRFEYKANYVNLYVIDIDLFRAKKNTAIVLSGIKK